MENNWYETEKTTGAVPEAPSLRGSSAGNDAGRRSPRKRRRAWIGWTVGTVAVVALIAVSSILFAVKSSPADPSTPGEPGTADPGDFSDYVEFFESYFSPSEESADCDIPRVDTFPGGELTLQPEGEELSLQEIYKRCVPSVVGIRAYLKENSKDSYYWGTGIVLTEDGVIVTNAHVVTGSGSSVPRRATVILYDDTEYEALLIGYDVRSDIALLKIDARGLTPAEFCDLASLEVGDSVVAIGNPLEEEFRNSMTEGIISGIDRGISRRGTTMTLIQTTAPINEGNSGGPLINRSGQVIGITNMKMSAHYIGSVTIEGVGFAIPATTIQTVAVSILDCGEMRGRPALGITVGPIPDQAVQEYDLPDGLYISAVSEGSDCQAQGIRPGDVLLAVDGESVTENQQVLQRLQDMSVGDTLVLTIWRQEKDEARVFDVTVTLVDVNDVY